jgi:endonuclease YncB( thermonuclease family)
MCISETYLTNSPTTNRFPGKALCGVCDMPRLAPFLLVWSCLSTLLHAEPQTLTGRCVGVHDGDSITVLAAGNVQLKVRLEGIDAPELKQPFSQQSKEALSGLVFGKALTLQRPLRANARRCHGRRRKREPHNCAIWLRVAFRQVQKGLRHCWQRRTPRKG